MVSTSLWLITTSAWVFCSLVTSQELGGLVCRLPRNEGFACGVTSPYAAFAFDVDKGECIEFVFQGCGGNQNRFSTKEECIRGCRSLTLCNKGMPLMDFAGNIKRCDGERVPCPGSHECVGSGMTSVCCMKPDRICGASLHSGTSCGVVPMTRYYFDDSSKTCRLFAYTGCGGNENNFKTKGECVKFCNTEVICPRGDPHPDRYSINSIATCTSDNQCPRNYTCTGRPDGKPGACCPSKEFVCGSPYEARSSCRTFAKEVTWTFDHKKRLCEKKDYSNCEEHFNSFAMLEQCTDFCVGSCPNGGDLHYNPLTGQPQLCDHVRNEGCPIGYQCVKSSPYASVCCRTEPVCPSGESLALIMSGIVHRCDPFNEDSCPAFYTCQQAPNNEHICCTAPLECPDGMDTLLDSAGAPRTCTIGIDDNCPADHMCVHSTPGPSGNTKSLCCKPRKRCISPYIDPKTKRLKRCFPGDGTCHSPSTCLPALEDTANMTNTIDVTFFCCRDVQVFTCPDASSPLLEPGGRPARCVKSNPFSCPSEYDCTELLDNTLACCQNPATREVCQEAAVDEEGNAITCKGWDDNSCPIGNCRKASDSKYYCCTPEPNVVPHVPIAIHSISRMSIETYLKNALKSLRILYKENVMLRDAHRVLGRP